jgi:hypothetical protein
MADDADQPGVSLGELVDLAVALWEHVEATGAADSLDDLVALWRVATTAMEGAPYHWRFVSRLSETLMLRFEHAGHHADLDEAIATTQRADSINPRNDAVLGDLASALTQRFALTGDPSDRDRSVAAYRDAAAATPPDRPVYALRLHFLAKALRSRFDDDGRPADLDEAIGAWRSALRAGTLSSGMEALSQYHLGYCLLARQGSPDDLDEAVTALRAALAADELEPDFRAAAEGNLGIALNERFRHSRRRSDSEEASALLRTSLAGRRPSRRSSRC